MDGIHDFDIIDVELDAYFKKKQASRCKDEFLNILCEEDDYEAVDDAQTKNHAQTDNDAKSRNDAQSGIIKEESDEDYLECSNEEDSDEEFEYSTHNPNVKWNKMRPTFGESIRLVAICGSDPEKCPFVVRASWMSTERSFQVKKMIDIHKCVRTFNTSRLMDPTWLARKFVKELIRKPNLNCKEMQGLVEASKDILPYFEHRKCARHIYAHFRKVYSGVQLINKFWAAIKCTTVGDFMFNMERIRAISYADYDHLMAREPTSWCRVYFSTAMACEAVENEIAECFNTIIVDARKKPLLTMLE
ncbi:unnamed protein product [Lactuca saligna]|uniref:Uncharacterized protein n=1 Tax=Lactuca saligna TaxID=75948 RepID=A0AA35VDH4_LACSI|nr:unnamed protein product [Lactuca saligna]